ncbi:MAG: hypothetical protein VW806_03245 [Halieaceae bacterium]|jgi:hypothetical protein
MKRSRFVTAVVLPITMGSASTWGDGSAISQVYAPYVQPLERELELLWLDETRPSGRIESNTLTKLGFGTSFLDGVYTELSVSKLDASSSDSTQVELEVIWQITEQGEYSSDWGLLFEAETNLDTHNHELSAGLLNQKDWKKFSLISNLVATYEWGSGFENEFESRLGLQARYRLQPEFEPMIEFFQGPDTTAIGPGAAGLIRLRPGRQLRWGFSILKGLNSELDYTAKLEFEYEFF